MVEWISWTNGFYLVGIVIAGTATMFASKYKAVITELVDVAEALEDAYKDGNLSIKEKEKIMKEILDVLKGVISLKWKIF